MGCYIFFRFEERGTIESPGNLSLELQKKILGLAELQTFLVASMKHFRGKKSSKGFFPPGYCFVSKSKACNVN